MTYDFENEFVELLGDNKVAVLTDPIDLESVARKIADAKNADGDDAAFMVGSLDTIVSRFAEWRTTFPNIEPFYAVKCNGDAVLLKTLSLLGVGFDCASKAEIEQVLDNGLASADQIIYANPCKTRSFVSYARERGVRMMTFDNVEELEKVAELHPDAELVLRIAVSDPSATCPLNHKFGAEPVHAAPLLLVKAASLQLRVIGVSFHVGSGCNDPTAFGIAVHHARNLFDLGAQLGHDMRLLDIGGGFPGHNRGHISLQAIAGVVTPALEVHFPRETGVRIIAEPGRYFAAAPFTLVANVIAATRVAGSHITKNDADADQSGYMYYINDGVYGSFNCILYDHVQPVGYPLFPDHQGAVDAGAGNETVFPTKIWGPTCDSLDLVEAQRWLPRMHVGDWICYNDMGAYTTAASTTFNGFQKPHQLYVVSRRVWDTLALLL